MPEPEAAQAAQPQQALDYAVASVTMTGRRRNNEDSCLAVTFTSKAHGPVAVLAVADGMGGLPGGAVASELAIESLREHLLEYQSGKRSNVREMLASAFRNAHTSVQARGAGDESARHLGTTLTVALMNGGGAVIAHVGDTRVYVIQEEMIRQVTHDHNIIQDMLDRELYTWEQICKNEAIRVNALTRCIGHEDTVVTDFVPVEPELRIELEPGMILFSCSDGLTGLVAGDDGIAKQGVADAEILARLTSAENLEEACKELVTLAYERGSRDNITVGAVSVHRAGEAPASPSGTGLSTLRTGGSFKRGAKRALATTGRGVRRSFDFQSVPTLVGWVCVALTACILLAAQMWGGGFSFVIREADPPPAANAGGAQPTQTPSPGANAPIVSFRGQPRDLGLNGVIRFGVRTARGEPASVESVRLTFFGKEFKFSDDQVRAASGGYAIEFLPLAQAILREDRNAKLSSGRVELSCTVGGREYAAQPTHGTVHPDVRTAVLKQLGYDETDEPPRDDPPPVEDGDGDAE